ncbi:putative Ubiquitin carboxyl-terminal hydrolase [Blattamonas nauphoetae]|uniref:ubiquitinyl hydrolase 1 n=1 Tax=Blattamonas nauphoetae TaxID=2049346 RepID=A0ABQ9YAP8_9EUKA|nr:putative Ubiquitin carboxyl-terminal hydrolase [Blattamonas nauphoetae]
MGKPKQKKKSIGICPHLQSVNWKHLQKDVNEFGALECCTCATNFTSSFTASTPDQLCICLMCGQLFCKQHKTKHNIDKKQHATFLHFSPNLYFSCVCRNKEQTIQLDDSPDEWPEEIQSHASTLTSLSAVFTAPQSSTGESLPPALSQGRKGKQGRNAAEATGIVDVPINTKKPKGYASSAPDRSDARDAEGMELVYGLTNLGNTCFFNSVLQCLLHCDPFVNFFLSDTVEREKQIITKGLSTHRISELSQMIESMRQKAEESTTSQSQNVKGTPKSADREVLSKREARRRKQELNARSSAPVAPPQPGDDFNVIHSTSPMTSAFSDLIHEIHTPHQNSSQKKQKVRTPSEIFGVLARKHRIYSSMDQQDSLDVLLTMLQMMSEEEERRKRRMLTAAIGSQILPKSSSNGDGEDEVSGENDGDDHISKETKSNLSPQLLASLPPLSTFRRAVHTALSLLQRKPSPQLVSLLPSPLTSLLLSGNISHPSRTFVEDVFSGSLKVRRCCLSCSSVSSSSISFYNLSLPLSSSPTQLVDGAFGRVKQLDSLEDALEVFCGLEVLQTDNAINCEECTRRKRKMGETEGSGKKEEEEDEKREERETAEAMEKLEHELRKMNVAKDKEEERDTPKLAEPSPSPSLTESESEEEEEQEEKEEGPQTDKSTPLENPADPSPNTEPAESSQNEGQTKDDPQPSACDEAEGEEKQTGSVKTPHLMQTKLDELPQVLVIHLNRFRQSTQTYQTSQRSQRGSKNKRSGVSTRTRVGMVKDDRFVSFPLVLQSQKWSDGGEEEWKRKVQDVSLMEKKEEGRKKKRKERVEQTEEGKEKKDNEDELEKNEEKGEEKKEKEIDASNEGSTTDVPKSDVEQKEDEAKTEKPNEGDQIVSKPPNDKEHVSEQPEDVSQRTQEAEPTNDSASRGSDATCDNPLPVTAEPEAEITTPSQPLSTDQTPSDTLTPQAQSDIPSSSDTAPTKPSPLPSFLTSTTPSTPPQSASPGVAYTLSSLVSHSGSLNGGHYISFFRPSLQCRPDVWVRASDASVHVVSVNEVLRTQAYILVYVRV